VQAVQLFPQVMGELLSAQVSGHLCWVDESQVKSQAPLLQMAVAPLGGVHAEQFCPQLWTELLSLQVPLQSCCVDGQPPELPDAPPVPAAPPCPPAPPAPPTPVPTPPSIGWYSRPVEQPAASNMAASASAREAPTTISFMAPPLPNEVIRT
jgi:hypothetical protein